MLNLAFDLPNLGAFILNFESPTLGSFTFLTLGTLGTLTLELLNGFLFNLLIILVPASSCHNNCIGKTLRFFTGN
jgi:hypothetical protein